MSDLDIKREREREREREELKKRKVTDETSLYNSIYHEEKARLSYV